MDQTKLNKLLEVAEQQDQVKLRVLHNAVISCVREYKDDSTAAKLKDWKSAEAALDEFADNLWKKHFGNDSQTLANLVAVVDWLTANGWKIKKTKLYSDAKKGKILREADGSYSIENVQKYASAYLQQLGSAGIYDASMFDFAKRKAKFEAEILASKALIFKAKADAASGMYVLRDDFEKALALRAAILKNDLEGFCRTYASEIINLVSGNAAKISELINYMLEKVEEILARYSEEKALSAPTLPIIEENDEDESEETIKEKKENNTKEKNNRSRM